MPEGWAKIPPDLTVEIVSPNDLVEEQDENLEDYWKVGVPLVWVINPNSRTVRVHRKDCSASDLHDAGELSGEDVIPGFRCPVREILPRREPPIETPSSPIGTNGPE